MNVDGDRLTELRTKYAGNEEVLGLVEEIITLASETYHQKLALRALLERPDQPGVREVAQAMVDA